MDWSSFQLERTSHYWLRRSRTVRFAKRRTEVGTQEVASAEEVTTAVEGASAEKGANAKKGATAASTQERVETVAGGTAELPREGPAT